MVAIVMLQVWILWFLPNGFGGPVGVTWVSGTSMEPGLYTGDLVITYEQPTYDVGDVVSFEIPQGGVVIHRIIEITDDGLYRFQGDNRKYEDPWSLPADSIVGAAVFEVHNASKIVGLLTRPLSLAVMVFAIVGLDLWQRASDNDEAVIDLSSDDDDRHRVGDEDLVIDLTDDEWSPAGAFSRRVREASPLRPSRA